MKHDIIPFVVFCGPLHNVKASLIFNEGSYDFKEPIRAVESCYKCLVALSAFTSIAEFAWSFIEQGVYGFKFKSAPSCVDKLLEVLDKL